MDMPQSVYPSSVDGLVGGFHILFVIKNIAINIFCDYVFISIGYIPRNGNAGSFGNCL